MNTTTPGPLKNKPHFEILDGLRGIAALAVVTFHFMEIAYTDYSKNFIGHGFLAVDFFFCLSGFVIGYAYDNRIGQMGIWAFFKARLIRLQPLVILGSVLGLLTFLFDPFSAVAHLYSPGKTLLFFLASVCLIPYPAMPERYFNLFSFNAPAWSLFWEYVANAVYALVLYRTGRRWLLSLAVLSAVAICYVAYHSGSIMGGWGGPNFWDGLARICYSFLAGLLVYRFNWIIKNKLGFAGLAVLLFLTFVMPFGKWNWLTEPFVVICFFPLLVALGAGAILNPRLKKLCIFSGQVSYPLYMTHYAVMWMFAGYYAKYKPDALQLSYIIITGLALLTTVAYIAMIWYDTPIRNYLNKKRGQTARN